MFGLWGYTSILVKDRFLISKIVLSFHLGSPCLSEYVYIYIVQVTNLYTDASIYINIFLLAIILL